MNKDGIKKHYPKALIIDDELDTCLLLGMLLKKFGIPSLKVHSLAEGYEMITTEKPELIFLDNNLPDGTGIERITSFRKQLPNSKLVMITAISSLREQALTLGVDGFIEKPLDIKKIENVLR
ncbi:response regulator receiver protein [Emticicia oligotrophica DSM 17448]|uniref:Response regulator receiver protein n=1 Tax=Emticicia oligotrophica (strain DSM 17448 / CIP 109782 / MTCC 6937 / GPTSA100-15) TaxID=929562 RepID=A0ABM5MZ03_EMTOG|nr:response regulator [Emticicia oligotrophica]AFK02320.1 response regulator receiver protein [Emticicia oligotrophica DSM 17448]